MLAGCSRAPEPYRQESYAFGTRVELAIAGVPEASARRAAALVLADLDHLHRALHPWQAGSPLVAVNAALAAGRPARVGPEIAELVALSQDYARRADGLFDPAIGALVQLWGFHADTYAPAAPPPAKLAELVAARPRMSDVTLAGDTLASANPAVQLDFGGIAKGWALDRARDTLKQAGVASALVNIGGNVLAVGRKPDGARWTVGLMAPRGAGAMATLALEDGEAVGTSGDYQRYFELAGRRHCHLIDPRDGGTDCALQAATVVAPPGARAGAISDAASKPVYFAGPARALHYARRFGVRDVLLVDGRGAVWLSAALAARLAWLPPRPAAIHTLNDTP
ncbi:thiamine biosynthesis lipoprotein [Crenobacter luteus]|uniref:FAD:protein FMN transferase n=1 Tax=Crenobacter luteus TaxID=1452487 RepID=A0A161SED5_9NEIS|nr:FAD:protein FMN transferase [Crenobacter luteus]KZE34853.1 thiamine biosynthesis protein ApbE [Crenobacter luteus]TCP15267.1 thiamine biosynthesis lipoprotein [Crenobacter luteus]